MSYQQPHDPPLAPRFQQPGDPAPHTVPIPYHIMSQALDALGKTPEDVEILRQSMPPEVQAQFDYSLLIQSENRASTEGQGLIAAVEERVQRLEVERRAKHLANDRRLEELESGVLSSSAEAFLKRIREGRLTDLSVLPDPIPIVGESANIGLLFTCTVNYIVGQSGSFKSVVALDIAGRVGQGLPFCGMPTTRSKVLYVVAEGAVGMKSRQKAWEMKHNDGQPMTGVDFIPFAIQMGDLDVEMPALIAYVREHGYGMVIFDTAAMCSIGVDENDNAEMTMLSAAVLQLAVATDACVLIVAHTPKAKDGGQATIRGAGSQYANSNTVITARRKGSDRRVTLSTSRDKDGKQKDAEEIEEMVFEVAKVGGSAALETGRMGGPTGDELPRTPPPLTGANHMQIVNLLLSVPNTGATRAEMVRMAANEGRPVQSVQVQRAVDALLGLKVVEAKGQRYKMTSLGMDAVQWARTAGRGYDDSE